MMVDYIKYDGPSLTLEIKGYPLYTIRPGSEFKIGRHQDNDLSVSDPTVSRFHAIIQWQEIYPIISDCQSTAGIKIDGIYAKFNYLNATHLIKLGQTKIKARYNPDEAHAKTQILDAPTTLPKQIQQYGQKNAKLADTQSKPKTT